MAPPLGLPDARRAIVAAVSLGLLTAAPSIAWSDAAPAPAQPGSSPRAGTVPTNVRMVTEDVLLEIEQAEAPANRGPGGAMVASVAADFTMRNLGERSESLEVWFPIFTGHAIPGGLLGTPEPPELAIGGDFAAWMDGLPAAIDRREVVENVAGRRAYSTYAVWKGTFLPGRDVAMRVTYSARPTVYGPLGTFAYVLDTGAGWRDTIGKATVTFRLPHDVNDVNAVLASEGVYDDLQPRPPGYVIAGTDVTWRLADLEPRASDNPRLTVLAPGIWRRVLDAREAVEREPVSSEAQVALAGALAEGVIYGSGMGVVWAGGDGRDLWRQADAAYRRALDLAPNDLDIHLRYLDMLWGDCVVCDVTSVPPNFVTTLSRALGLAPTDPTLLEYQSQLSAYGTSIAKSVATLTQQASQAGRPSSATGSPPLAATAGTRAVAAATVAQRLETPSPAMRPVPTAAAAPGRDRAASAGQARGPLVVLGVVLLMVIGLAAWTKRRPG